MATTLFQYPGGKSGEFERIRGIMPHHTCFVEGFGGSGTITLNKRASDVDVYNDLDSELVNFFTVYRESGERLCNWLDEVPYSYETYEDFTDAFYGEAGEDPDGRLPGQPVDHHLVGPDDITHENIQRAGVFFTLRYMQFGAKYNGRSGFGRSKVQNGASTFSNAKERLRDYVGCWDHVTIENVSYEKLIDTYDSEDTLFYFDPPYIGTEQYYRENQFSHTKFCDNLDRIEGHFIVSYDKIPERLEQYHVSRQESTNFIDSGVKGEGKATVETLVTNFNPDDVRKWSGEGSNQTGMSDWNTSPEAAVDGGDEVTAFKEDGTGQDEKSDGTSEETSDGGFLAGIDTDEDEESGFLDDEI